MESAILCHDAQAVGFYVGSNPLRVSAVVAKSEDYTTVLQHLQITIHITWYRNDY